jgi:hypothetical protein
MAKKKSNRALERLIDDIPLAFGEQTQNYKCEISGNQIHVWTEDGKSRFLVTVQEVSLDNQSKTG